MWESFVNSFIFLLNVVKYRAKEVDFMYTLFIDTHDEVITVSLVNESNVFTKEQASFHKHAVYLVPMIRSILSENNLTVYCWGESFYEPFISPL